MPFNTKKKSAVRKIKLRGGRTIVGPRKGWEGETYYLVDVSWTDTNPVHRAIFYSGTLNGGLPGGGNQVLSPSYGYAIQRLVRDLANVRFLRVVSEVCARQDMVTCGSRLPSEVELCIAIEDENGREGGE